SGGDPTAERALARAAERPSDASGELAAMLLEALRSRQPDRNAALDRATRWMRTHHPQARRLWEGWEERDGVLVRRPAPELREKPLESSGRPSRDPNRSSEPQERQR